MQHIVTGKQIDVGESLRDKIVDSLRSIIGKFFQDGIESSTVLSHAPHHHYQADISVHVGKGIRVQGRGEGTDPHNAVINALDRISKQLARYKQRIKNHHKTHKELANLHASQAYIIASEPNQSSEPDNLNPAIIAENSVDIPLLTVGEAVMRMDLEDAPAYVFVNKAHKRVNFIYRRDDGNIGWVDPKAEQV